MNKNVNHNSETSICTHQNLMQDGPYIVCKDCGLIVDEGLEFETSSSASFYSDSQQAYERKIRVSDSRAIQDPKIKQKYEKLRTLDRWFRDYHTNFSEQKKTIDLLKSYGIGLNIDNVKYQHIKDRYLRYNKYHRQTYQNMIIIFLAIVWLEIKDTTNIRVEEFIDASRELGHKINKKMLNNAMEKITRTETNLDDRQTKSVSQLEQDIKKKIKILLQKDMNNISFDEVKEYISSREDFNKLKIDMQLIADKILKNIPYRYLQNLNYKAFTAGLIYYIGQTLENPKIFTQSLVEKTSRFSSTTIRKKFHILKDLLGDPTKLKV